ncbi:glucose/sorbosone family PQQ-dependent dehydrogenase [Massilia aquatica]|uniref:Quinoprotein glucose dehydrogenase n=1 Tax=Massilia aquatica TaxID=2609000 RepID=A0ABX0MEU8_9BURK|nr:glucose/sorbosone family PQQ-dependent dehydrogenase [Massilia aquatica]NHZ43480.1 quinoprotein glucose dehydrogenase [Massilia aquatica]
MNRHAIAPTLILLLAASAPAWAEPPPPTGARVAPLPPGFAKSVLASGFANPHNMVLGPDGQLWLTEQTGKRVLRVDPASGKKTVIATIEDVVSSDKAQDGLLGLALHPDLLKKRGRDYVYVSFSYASGEGGAFPNRTAIRRYTYDAKTRKLGAPKDVIKGLPSSHDHQSARLLFGPDQKLYYAIGDQGANQMSYLCVPNLAQALPSAAEVGAADWRHYRGKILRLNQDGSIPLDNPVIHGVKSHVYAWGIRNTQGMVFSPAGQLYATEQGPNTDDELNLILAGRNYGWPNVAGYKDNAAYAYANYSKAEGGCDGVKDPAANGTSVPPGVPVQKESAWSDPDFVEPLKTFYTVDNSFSFKDPVCADNSLYYICWPTVAPSSVAYYKGGKAGVPGWENSLLIGSLKRGTIYRVRLDATGHVPLGDAEPLFRSVNRYRDVVVSADGATIYVATDVEGSLGTGENGAPASRLENPGAILVFKYSGAR